MLRMSLTRHQPRFRLSIGFATAVAALRRLHAEAGNHQKSAEFDRRLADLWRNADPELRQKENASR